MLKPEDGLLALRDGTTGKPVSAHGGSIFWNAHRKRWVMIPVDAAGTAFLGEVWFAGPDTPRGPWVPPRHRATPAPARSSSSTATVSTTS